MSIAAAASRVPVRSMVPERGDVDAHPEEQHTVAVIAVPAGTTPAASSAIDVSTQVDATGRLRWDAPAGRWNVYRFAY